MATKDHITVRFVQVETEGLLGKIVFVITTDGLENVSYEFTYEQIKEMIIHQQDKCRWNFKFLGINIDAVSEAEKLGTYTDFARNYEASGGSCIPACDYPMQCIFWMDVPYFQGFRHQYFDMY